MKIFLKELRETLIWLKIIARKGMVAGYAAPAVPPYLLLAIFRPAQKV